MINKVKIIIIDDLCMGLDPSIFCWGNAIFGKYGNFVQMVSAGMDRSIIWVMIINKTGQSLLSV